MSIHRTVFECEECGWRYKATFYEPTWLAMKYVKKEHPAFHKMSATEDYPSQWKQIGISAEQDRIIKLLNDYSNGETLISVDVAITLIKGENK